VKRMQSEVGHRDEEMDASFRDHLQKVYGGCWRYNEIVGYIRLHFLGSQVRGEYFGVACKRMVRTRRRVLQYKGWKLAPEVEVQFPVSNKKILAAIRQYLQDCGNELPGRYIDTEMFEAVAGHINWKALFLTHLKRP
jgi:hypothetical protein